MYRVSAWRERAGTVGRGEDKRGEGQDLATATAESRRAPRWWTYLLALWAVAFAEELLWDRAVWHERPWLFGDGWDTGGGPWRAIVVAVLSVPQITHYLLDGFVWRRRANPRVATLVAEDPR